MAFPKFQAGASRIPKGKVAPGKPSAASPSIPGKPAPKNFKAPKVLKKAKSAGGASNPFANAAKISGGPSF